ncbi:MAG: hypothetical protein KDN22_03040 [Verrucomicrobiae bacterium]|nr:hypothetical protein [Verrucomicrobiae bacterium]
MNNTQYGDISSDALREAADIRDRIDKLNTELASILTGASAAEAPVVSPKRRGRPPGAKNVVSSITREARPQKRRKRKMSPEGIERIRAAQKARWAKIKKQD